MAAKKNWNCFFNFLLIRIIIWLHTQYDEYSQISSFDNDTQNPLRLWFVATFTPVLQIASLNMLVLGLHNTIVYMMVPAVFFIAFLLAPITAGMFFFNNRIQSFNSEPLATLYKTCRSQFQHLLTNTKDLINIIFFQFKFNDI